MKPLYGPAMDALGGAAGAARFLEPPPGRWDYIARDNVLKHTRAERKGYYVAAHWGVWAQWTGDARVTRVDLCVDIVADMPPFPGCDAGWRIVDSPDGTTYYYDSTECTWRVYRYKTREAAEKRRPVDYLAQLDDGCVDAPSVVRYECELHGSLARSAAALSNAAEAWSRVAAPPDFAVPRPTVPGPVLAPDRRPTVPPRSVDEAVERLRKYITDSARRHARRTGVTRDEYEDALWRGVARELGRRKRAGKDATPERELSVKVQSARRRKPPG